MENKDTAFQIMLELDDRELFILCGKEKSLEFKNKKFSKYCNNKIFWEKRFVNRFGLLAGSYKPKDRTWKRHYLTVVSQLDEYKDNPWKFFNLIYWNIATKPENANFLILDSYINVDKAPERLHNSFWMLELGKDITIEYPVYNYNGKDYIQRRYKNDTNYTPGKVLKLIYDFYQEPMNYEGDDDVSEEDDVKLIDFMQTYRFFEGFTDENGVKNLSLNFR